MIDLVQTLELWHRPFELPARWISHPVYDPNDPMITVGYTVMWSKQIKGKGYLRVGHYYAGENGDPSLNWCQVACESHAKRLNEEGRRP